MFHLDCPIDVPLKEYCDTIAGHTSDMGVEMSTPDFKLNDDEGPESLLLAWIDREPLREDVGDGVLSEEDDDEELFVDLNDGFGPPSPPPSPPPPEHVDKVALEKALTVYGLQHCTDDLNHDFVRNTMSQRELEQVWQPNLMFKNALGPQNPVGSITGTLIRETEPLQENIFIKKECMFIFILIELILFFSILFCNIYCGYLTDFSSAKPS